MGEIEVVSVDSSFKSLVVREEGGNVVVEMGRDVIEGVFFFLVKEI